MNDLYLHVFFIEDFRDLYPCHHFLTPFLPFKYKGPNFVFTTTIPHIIWSRLVIFARIFVLLITYVELNYLLKNS